ncbi:MAG: DNA polymerase III subunit delta' [Gammaproteobacteria bacterium]|nr:DNA polymerase III subunit delta' [Gammaproteobacteria bacterium]
MPVHPWNQTVWEHLTAPRTRSTHAWLFAGARGLGKTHCAMAFAKHLLGANNDARTGKFFEAGSHPDMHVIARAIDIEDSDALHHRYARRHTEERAKGTKPKTVIAIGQIRHLIESLNTRAHSGQCKVALLSDAHTMNINAANALLKLLEEPPEDTVLVCVTDRMHRLPATVRSRCAIVTFSVPPRDTARGWLTTQVDTESVDVALDLAGGAPLEALRLIQEDRIQTRRKWLTGLEALCSGKADAASIAELGKQIGLPDALALSQKVLVDLARRRLRAPPDRLFNSDESQWLQKRSKRLQLEVTFALINKIGRMRQDIDSPLDANLLLEDMLIQMRYAVTGGT